MAAPAKVPALRPGFAKFHESDMFSDCTIICGSYQVKVHKVILCGQSEYFTTALKSGTFKEGETGVIELKATSDDETQTEDCCDDPGIVKLMIEYFYHFDYLRTLDSAFASATTRKVYLIEHAKVFAMAVKYQAEGLRRIAAQKFEDCIQTDWDHEDLAEAIHVVYHSTADDVTELREIVFDTVYAHFDVLNKREEVKAIVRNMSSLAYNLLERSHKIAAAVCAHKQVGNVGAHNCSYCSYSYYYCRQCYGFSTSMRASCPKCGRHD